MTARGRAGNRTRREQEVSPDAVQASSFFPLVPRARLHLFVWAVETRIKRSEVERFTRLFREVWRLVPARDRQALLRYWGKARAELRSMDPPTENPGALVPFIELCENKWGRGRGLVNGSTNHDGSLLTFVAERLPRCEGGVRAIIAHELAHVRLIAAGCDPWWNRPPMADKTDYVLSPIETAADLLAAAWGCEDPNHVRTSDWFGIEGAIRRNPNHPVAGWLRRRFPK